MLSPTERLEFELRNSPSTDLVRRQAAHCELTEEEFRAVAEARLAFDKELANPQSEVQITQALRIYDEPLRQVLGDDRSSKLLEDDPVTHCSPSGDKPPAYIPRPPAVGPQKWASLMIAGCYAGFRISMDTVYFRGHFLLGASRARLVLRAWCLDRNLALAAHELPS